MKKYFKKILELSPIILIIGLLFFKAPQFYRQYKLENTVAPAFELQILNGGTFNLADQRKKLVLVFWATWCGPCSVELSRLNKMVQNKEIEATDVLAISIGESEQAVKQAVTERGYLFQVGLDPQFKVSELYHIAVTPTVVFLNENKQMQWVSSGLSPLLGLRLWNFL